MFLDNVFRNDKLTTPTDMFDAYDEYFGNTISKFHITYRRFCIDAYRISVYVGGSAVCYGDGCTSS